MRLAFASFLPPCPYCIGHRLEDALPPSLLWSMLCHRHCSGGCFATIVGRCLLWVDLLGCFGLHHHMADALPHSLLSWIFFTALASCRYLGIVLADVLPPSLVVVPFGKMICCHGRADWVDTLRLCHHLGGCFTKRIMLFEWMLCHLCISTTLSSLTKVG